MIAMPTFTFITTFLIMLVKITWCAPQTNIEKKVEGDLKAVDVLNVCLESSRHKKIPGPEHHLIEECQRWKNNACCTPETVGKAHTFSLYDMSYDMCPQQNMSEACKKFFIRDTCFYECSPNIGPWKMKGDDHNKERFKDVPLCKSECDNWYKACAEDYTCTDNWSKMVYENSSICGNNGKECVTISQMFPTSTSFCEKIWDNSWKVVNDSEHCMVTSFDIAENNPNNLVAIKYAQEKYGDTMDIVNGNLSNQTAFPNVFLCIAVLIISLCSYPY